ncbi:CopG family transcriptional regulator [Actinophytocola sp.]|uniref:ribbon-helix-helix domain-containing protein n=1 Tax=Actinophytocola sp. TaxID=1872138 RepID=UPI003899CF6A
MKRTNIYLDEEQAELLDSLAHSQGVSRAEIIRRLLDRSLHDEVDDVAVGLAAIDESFGVLADADDEWPERRASGREDHLARMWAARP